MPSRGFHGSEPVLPESDDELIARILANDERAFAELFERYWKPLVRYAHDLLEDPDGAADVVQEALTQILIERQRLSAVNSLKGYVYRIVHNRAIDCRRRSVRRLQLLREHQARAIVESRPSTMGSEELPGLLQEALKALPARRRQVFSLAHLHDLSYAEIAEILEISPQTVANQISRALATLRVQLAPHKHKLRWPR